MVRFSKKIEWVSTDGWRGHERPAYAVAGASDTGTWNDSPCPTHLVTSELNDLKKHLKEKGIHFREMVTKSSNVFCVKRWIISSIEEFDKACKIADKWLQKYYKDTNYIHER